MSHTTSRPRTIQIFLPSGDPRGVRVAELTTSIVRAIEVPRALLDNFLAMPEAKQAGLYFLIGDNDDQDFPSAYIGQTGSVGERLATHHKQKEFWNRALVVVSQTKSFTTAHTQFLEWCSITHANKAGRYKVLNGKGGSISDTPAPLEADCWEIFETLRILIATLGQPVLDSLSTSKEAATNEEMFYCKSTFYDAVAQYTPEGMVVLKGSKARKEMVPSTTEAERKRRELFIAEKAMVLKRSSYVFTRDVLFRTPSGASDAVTGASTNGWNFWKTKDGRTLGELKRQSTDSSAAVAQTESTH